MLLPTIGERLRARRLSLGLSQAAVGAAAGVSLRFLGQVEAGRGNISVTRLADVCAALDLSLAQLFAGLGPGGPAGIALVGLRGAGKSTIGARVAARRGLPFVELDKVIEARAGMSLAELIELGGEPRYRQVEVEAVAAILAGPPVVLATGGGLVSAPATWLRLRQGARTVWLQASPESHLARVRAQGDLRPMRGRPDPLGELRSILAERAPLYAEADLHLDTDALGVDQVVERLAAW